MNLAALCSSLVCLLSVSGCAMGAASPDEAQEEDPGAVAETTDALTTVLVTADMPTSTATDGSYVYFTAWNASFEEHVYRAPVGGGSKQALVSCSGCGKLAVDGSYVYFNNGAAVFRIPRAGGTKTKLAASAVDRFADMAVDASYVYFAAHDGVKRVPKAGGSVKVLSTGANNVRGLTLDSTYVYWVNIGTTSQGTIRRVPKAGGTSKTLLSATQPYDVAVDSSNLYWTSLQGLVWKSAKDGNNPWPVASGQSMPTDLASNSTALFWTNSPGTGYGSVKRMVKLTGAVTTLASSQSGPESIALSGSAVYWSNYTGDRVMKATF